MIFRQDGKTPNREIGVNCKYCKGIFIADELEDLIPSKTASGILGRPKYTYMYICPNCKNIISVPAKSISRATRKQVQ